jgi:hypothetical protein
MAAAMEQHQQHPDTRALARFLIAVAACTIMLFVGLVVTIGIAPETPAQAPIATVRR